jgi:plasminogen activator
MKKSLFILIFITIFPILALAEVEKSIKVHISNINATSDEIVYNTDGSKLSHLYWRLEDVKLIGITGSALLNERVMLSVDYKTNFDNPDSTMDDYDWDTDNYSVGSGGYTHWSHHEKTEVSEVTKIDLNLQVGVAPTPIGIVYGMVGYKKDTFKWIARGGFYEYASNNFTRVYIDDNEEAISYNQYIETSYLGLGLVNNNLPNLKFDLNIKYAWGVSINDEDTHHQRTGTVTGSVGTYSYDGLYFEDFTDDATMLEYSLGISLEILKNLNIYLNYTNTDFTIGKGYTKTSYMGTPYYSISSSGTAGSSHESEMYSLGVKYDF